MNAFKVVASGLMASFLAAACGASKANSSLEASTAVNSSNTDKGVNVKCYGFGTTEEYGDINITGDLLFADTDNHVSGILYLDAYANAGRVHKGQVEFEGVTTSYGLDQAHLEIGQILLVPKTDLWKTEISKIALFGGSGNRLVSYAKSASGFLMLTHCDFKPIK